MQTIQLQQTGDIYTCDIGISKDEWLEILQDRRTPEAYIEAVLRFFYYPAHRGSCTAVSNVMGGKPQSLNAYITSFGEYVQKRLGRFQVVRPNGKPCYWIVPMCEGKDLPAGAEGTFGWELRPELVEAIREYLYWYLVECYKRVRSEIRLDDKVWDEQYKWKLITECKGKSLIDIVNKVRITNLIYTALISPTLDFAIKSRRPDFEQVLKDLTDEEKPLAKRIQTYAEMMKIVANNPANDKQSQFANDERTAAAILTCVNPNVYAIYKFDVYKLLCHYLSVETRPTGQCYVHFLELLQPLRELVEQDEALQQLVAPSLEGLEKSNLMLAQDVLWVLFVSFPKRLGFVYPFIWRSRYWYVGYSFGATNSQLSRFLTDGVWESRYSNTKLDAGLLQMARKIRVGDTLILKSSFTKGTNHDQPAIRISAIGEVTEIHDTVISDEGQTVFSCQVNYVNTDVQDFDGKKYGKYRRTIDECKDKEIISYINSIRNTIPTMKYEQYIKLLETNRNLILTGAPGTGKTHLAKEIAREMNAEWEFVQFHPSYDYSDFVEGLRPTKPDTNGNVGFKREDGVFKKFCADALRNQLDSEKSREELEKEKSLRQNFGEFVSDAINDEIQFKTDKTNNEFYITGIDEKYLYISIPQNEKVREIVVNMNDMMLVLEAVKKFSSVGEIKTIFNRSYNWQQDSYMFVLYKEFSKRKQKAITVEQVQLKPYVFIIDEINRGEISKIFGELFFSIDPGYRGEQGRVQTQYQNMVEDGDVFKQGFYVPENAYIIGTMNDIDRSVESMDFAMRRRFAWKEVTAEDSMTMLDNNDELAGAPIEEIKNRMRNLNKAILETEGLGEAYQIGAAYFLKYALYAEAEQPFECLWEHHLKGLLFEYLRGNRNAKEQLELLHQAYQNEKAADEQPADTDEG